MTEFVFFTLNSMLLLVSHSVVSDSLVTPWTVARQAPLSMGFPVVMYRCESWTVKKAERRRIDAFAL